MKCYECGKDLVAFSGFECSYCGKTFCAEHRLPESHHCLMSERNKEHKLKDRRKEHRPGTLSRLARRLGF